MKRKGLTINEFGTIALMFVVAAVVISITGTILTNVKSTQCTAGTTDWNATTGECLAGKTTIASNATGQGLTGIDTMADWLPTIAIIIAAAIVIGIIVSYFRG